MRFGRRGDVVKLTVGFLELQEGTSDSCGERAVSVVAGQRRALTVRSSHRPFLVHRGAHVVLARGLVEAENDTPAICDRRRSSFDDNTTLTYRCLDG